MRIPFSAFGSGEYCKAATEISRLFVRVKLLNFLTEPKRPIVRPTTGRRLRRGSSAG